jgi:hypothetical protein
MQVETKMAATSEKAVANFNTHIGAQIKELGGGVHELIQALGKAGDATLPPEAVQHLQEGQTTHFANGKRYTLSGGQPLEVAGE